MILQQPYDFRGLKWADNQSVSEGINRYIVTDYSYLRDNELVALQPFEGETTLKPVVLYGLTSIEKEIPIFNHPLINSKYNWIALDLRQMVAIDSQTRQVRPRNEGEYRLAVQRFVLSGMWATGKQATVYGYKFPHLVYAEFVSSSIARKFGLHAGDQVRLKILAALFYTAQFTNDPLNSDDLDKLRIRLKNEVFVDDLFDEVFAFKHLMGSLDQFGQACYELTNNVRLKGLDFNGMVSVFSTSWFGLNAKEMMLLALEHPPTWCAMVFACLSERSYKNSGLAKAVDQKDKKDAGKEFLSELGYHTKTYKKD